MNGPRPRVIIVGAGFAGLTVAKRLARAAVDITLIDRENHHLFQPLLYQVATAGLSPADIAWPIRGLVRHQRNTRVLLGAVTGVDRLRKRVIMGNHHIAYDVLVLATGATHSYFGNDSWAAHAPGLKAIDDAMDIRRRRRTGAQDARGHGDLGGRGRRLTGKAAPPPFRYRDRGLLATVERKSAVIAFKRLQLKGWFAWWIWGIAHIYFLVSLRNRLIVMTQWLWSYVSFERGTRLITGLRTTLEPDRLDHRDDDARSSPTGQTKSGID